jgi:hypothetical protein
MLTHLIQSNDKAIFLIDEPDIYLHSDLQRQLLGLLRNLGPDILIATHSTEIISEAEADDIVIINKRRKAGQRIQNPSQLGDVFRTLGSNLNPVLTQLAKTKKAVFVEGKDFQIISRFGRKLNFTSVSNRNDFAVIPIEGFNPERVRNLKKGMETTLGGSVMAAIVLDKDYRSEGECSFISAQCELFCDHVSIHKYKEIENFLLVPSAMNRAAARRVADYQKRGGQIAKSPPDVTEALEKFALDKKTYVFGQQLSERKRFERTNAPNVADATVNQAALEEFEKTWNDAESRFRMIPGKDALSAVNRYLQETHSISITPTGIVDAMLSEEVPSEMKTLVNLLATFASKTAANS